MPGRHLRTLKTEKTCFEGTVLRDTMKSWSDSQSDLCSSDQEEEDMIFGENEEDLEEMMDLSDLPTSLFACSVHEAVFEVQEQKITMTTATPLGGTPFFSVNMTTREEDFLYKSSGAIVAAIVVVVVIIFTVVLILLKMYNRKMRIRRELEPKSPRPASPAALGRNGNSSQHPATVTFSPVDVHVETP
uniref:RCAN family member 3 n=1 Tax=Sus scrofa TaxID=9823 RepID=A0A8D1RIS4_PIG